MKKIVKYDQALVIAKNLKMILTKKSLSPKNIAGYLDLDTIYNLCSGTRTNPHLGTLMSIAKELNVSISEILGTKPPEPGSIFTLNLLLIEKKISKCKLARGISVNVSVIYRLCAGETTNPQLKTLIKIADFLKVPIEQVMFVTSSHEKILREFVPGRRPSKSIKSFDLKFFAGDICSKYFS